MPNKFFLGRTITTPMTASSTTTAHLLFCHEPNMVNLSAAALTAIIAILSACETYNLASRQNDIINKMYDRNKQH